MGLIVIAITVILTVASVFIVFIAITEPTITVSAADLDSIAEQQMKEQGLDVETIDDILRSCHERTRI